MIGKYGGWAGVVVSNDWKMEGGSFSNDWKIRVSQGVYFPMIGKYEVPGKLFSNDWKIRVFQGVYFPMIGKQGWSGGRVFQ